jgi:hypothetical protein
MHSRGSPETRLSTHTKSSAALEASDKSNCASSSANTQPAVRSVGTRSAMVGEASDSGAGMKHLSVIREHLALYEAGRPERHKELPKTDEAGIGLTSFATAGT